MPALFVIFKPEGSTYGTYVADYTVVHNSPFTVVLGTLPGASCMLSEHSHGTMSLDIATSGTRGGQWGKDLTPPKKWDVKDYTITAICSLGGHTATDTQAVHITWLHDIAYTRPPSRRAMRTRSLRGCGALTIWRPTSQDLTPSRQGLDRGHARWLRWAGAITTRCTHGPPPGTSISPVKSGGGGMGRRGRSLVRDCEERSGARDLDRE
jgi:hypothetical protein